MILSKDFTRNEYTYNSIALELGIDNRLPTSARRVVQNLFKMILQPLQDSLKGLGDDYSVRIIKGYISPKLGDVIGMDMMDQHIASNATGAAVDIIVDKLDPITLMKFILDEGLVFDKMVWEYPNTFNNGWVHLSTAGIDDPFADQIMIRDFKKPLFLLSRDEIYQL